MNATGKPQAHPLQKLVAAFRVLAYGESYHRADEYVRLSRSTIARAVKLFTEFVVDEFGPQYLRPPTPPEIENMLARNAERGLPGCLGSLDCSHWEWSSCSKAREGTYQGRDGRRSTVIEAICDEDTWIYHIFAGSPGSLNDINVSYQLPMYMDVITGKWPPRSFTVNGNTRTLLYYLVDGIYPRFPFFVAPYPNPQTLEQRIFNRLQEAVRKDVELLFGILTARFHVMLHPCFMWTVPQMVLTTQTVAILHNMVVEALRDSFLSRSRSSHYGEDAAGVADELGAGGAGAGAADGTAAAIGAGVGGGAAGEDGVGRSHAGAGASNGAGGAAGAAGARGGAADGAGAANGAAVGGDAAGGADGDGEGAGPGATDGEGGAAGAAVAGAGSADGAVQGAAAAGGAAGGGTGAGMGGGALGVAGLGGHGGGGTGVGGDGAGSAGAGEGGGLGGFDSTPGVALPALGAAAVAPMSAFMRILMATGKAKSREEHAALREDLCAHVFAQRSEFLKPYLD